MKPTPLLDFWQKPPDAGEPVAVFATTFALEPDFFERNCLARFLEVSSVDEDSGSIEDVVAGVELHELLHKTTVTVLADRSAPVQRTSLLWDLLGCRVEGGLLHAKVAVLLWEHATRVILGSANLTAAGYRRQIELGLAADLGAGCLLAPDVLYALADELASYPALVPGHDPEAPVFMRANRTLALFRQRVAQQPQRRSALRVAFAPTNAEARPFDTFERAWEGPRPLSATHLSPFWDADDDSAIVETRQLLTGRPASARQHCVAVVPNPRGRVAFPAALSKHVGPIRRLQAFDQEVRTLHAKCLLLESEGWVAALVGSSNHTKSGLGLWARRHREANVWLGAAKGSREGQALLNLIQLGDRLAPDTPEADCADEDEVDLPSLPSCFGLCRVVQGDVVGSWRLILGIQPSRDMPPAWKIRLTVDEPTLLAREHWDSKRAAQIAITLERQSLPMYVLVEWGPHRVPWAVIADERQALPPLPAIAKLDARQLLEALAAGRSLAQVVRDALEQEGPGAARAIAGIDLNPLTRLEVHGSLLRKGRALAASLQAMQRRLERPAVNLDELRSRLGSPLGPTFVATKIVEAFEAGRQSRAEAIFTIAEIALTVGRVDWPAVLQQAEGRDGMRLVADSLTNLDTLRQRVDQAPADLMSYAERAIRESRKCLLD